jgi:uncharacterized membrane protein
VQYDQEQRVDEYLQRVSEALGDLPERERSEILEDLRSHLSESVGGDVRFASEADVRNALDRLGDPEDVAREARLMRGHDDVTPLPPKSSQYTAEHSRTPGTLEVAAIVLTALMWPIGVVLAWISDRWRTRDKVIATIIPLTSAIILGVIVVAGMFLWESGDTLVYEAAAPQDPVQTEPRSPANVPEPDSGGGVFGRLVLVLAFLGGAIAAPFISAVFLAVRMLPVNRTNGTEMDSRRFRDATPTMPGTRAW